MRLLATKKLSPSLKDRLVQHGFSLVEYSFIEIKPLTVQIKSTFDHLIFTSQNAVKIAFSHPEIKSQLREKKYFCVGEKTKSLLEENGQKVIKMTQNSSELAHFLVKNFKNEAFSFFCGKRRRSEIESFFLKNNTPLEIHQLSDTLLTPYKIENTFDGVLFFSPSAVESYFELNTWHPNTQGFCIGKTTASALQKYTSKYQIAKQPNEAQLLLSLRNYYTQDHAQK